jgi:hypothetical protein
VNPLIQDWFSKVLALLNQSTLGSLVWPKTQMPVIYSPNRLARLCTEYDGLRLLASSITPLVKIHSA